ncbi:MAG: peptidyl-alpha-hydroxyglycine alpha-amidating lyase family protein [Planctomycetaceae bacterium]
MGSGIVGVGHGISVDADDKIWVTDTEHHTIYKFDAEGKLLTTLGQKDKPGLGDNQFNKPTYIVFGLDGHMFIMDGYGNSRIVRYSSDGKFEKTWGDAGDGPGQFKSPHAAVVDRNGRLVVCDRDNNRIQIFDREGTLLETWTGYTPFGIAQDQEGRIFISDAKRQQVMQLDDSGKVVDAWGAEGTAPGEFKTPHLICADSKGNIYIAEVAGRRFQKLKRE